MSDNQANISKQRKLFFTHFLMTWEGDVTFKDR
jgi:hypothetical protein